MRSSRTSLCMKRTLFCVICVGVAMQASSACHYSKRFRVRQHLGIIIASLTVAAAEDQTGRPSRYSDVPVVFTAILAIPKRPLCLSRSICNQDLTRMLQTAQKLALCSYDEVAYIAENCQSTYMPSLYLESSCHPLEDKDG